MQQSSLTPAERARKTHSTVLQALSRPGTQAALAVALGVSESNISRLKNEHLEPVCQLLAHLGLKLVPSDAMVCSRDTANAIFHLARARLNTASGADALAEDY